MLTTANTGKIGRGFGKNAGEWTRRVEIGKEEIPGSKRSIPAGKASCKATLICTRTVVNEACCKATFIYTHTVVGEDCCKAKQH